eukprot:14160040-Ditylum_brightwellii.AAC.1
MQQNKVYLTRNGQQTPLRQYNKTEGIKVLGVHKALNLQERSVIQYLQGKMHHFTKAINSCPIPRSKVIAAYDSIYIPSIAYVLPATSCTMLDYEYRKAKSDK